MVRNVSRMGLCIFVFCFCAVLSANVICIAQTTPPDCTNGDCPPPPPDCTNGDCPPPPPDCTNGDCPPPPPDCTNGDCPPEPPVDCCCVGSNLPDTTRVCCCRSADLDTVQCRESLVLDIADPEFHITLVDETLEGLRPRSCDPLLQRFCNPPVEEVCKWKRGQRICEKVINRVCTALDQVCQYRFCGPEWFPFDEPAPDKDGCGWWDQIRECQR
jgi:hypothetical protein